MDIKVLTEDKNLEIKKFAKKEWKKFNLEHYGKEDVWFDEETFFLKAEEDGEILGYIKLEMESGVAFIDALLVKADSQGKGIGEKLIKKAEELSKEKGCHKIQLYTGKNWKQRSFYDHLGYTKTSDLPDQYMHQDFVEYTKYLER